MHSRRPRIGIYEPSSGPSGPSRYVESILSAIDPDEFDIVLFCRSGGPYAPRAGVTLVEVMPQARPASVTKEPPTKPLARSPWRAATPKWVRLWSGFGQETLRLAAHFRRHKVDLLHTNNAGCEESAVAARIAAITRVLGTFHVDSRVDVARTRDGFRYRALEFVSNQCLHAAIAVSDATGREWARRTRIASRRIVTIRNGINTESCASAPDKRVARENLGLPKGDAFIVGGVGRLDAVKGFDVLLDAIALLAPQFPTLHLALAGDGPLRQTLEQQAIRLGIARRVHFLGFRRDVSLVFDALDLFAMPSRCEALPYALLEAMATRLPAVASDVGGVPEVVIHGQTGLLAPVGDHAQFATGIRTLLQDADLRQRMGEAARQRVITEFNQRDMVARTLQLYRRLLSGAGVSSVQMAA